MLLVSGLLGPGDLTKEQVMNLQSRARRAIVLAAISTSVVVAVGAASVAGADRTVPWDLTDNGPATSTAGDSPPGVAVDDSAPGPDGVIAEPAGDNAVAAPTTLTSPTTQPPAMIVTTTIPPAAIVTTTIPPAAIATTTTTIPQAAIATVVAATAATAPRSPVATSGIASVKLTWLAPLSNGGAAIDKYAVQRSTSAAGPWTNIAYPAVPGYTATSLVNGTKYYFRIVAHNAAGWSPVSTVVSAVPRTMPSAPRSPVATSGIASVKLTWLAPSSNGGAAIDKYAVQRSTSAAGPWTNIAYPAVPGYTATSLVNGTKYYFRIVAHNAAGWSPVSTVVSAVPRTMPTAPRSPVATSGIASVKLTWLAPLSNGGAAIDKYAVQRSTSAAGPWTNIAYPAVPGYTATSLVNGTKYYFRIVAHNAAGWSPVSTVVSAVPRTMPSAPQNCISSQPYGPGSHTMQVVWFPPQSDGGAPITSYRVEVWWGFYLYQVKFVVPAVNQYNTNVTYVSVPTLNDYWQVKVFALNEASPFVGVDQGQAEGSSCLEGEWMES